MPTTKITQLPVDEHGMVNPDDITNFITNTGGQYHGYNTVLVSIMFANNEVGTIQPIKKISEICKENNIAFHTDAVQAVGKVSINVKELGVDFLSISSHKINGPKGVGALFIRKDRMVGQFFNELPYIRGGGQENGLRSGTENVASIVGFGKACEIAKEKLTENISHFKKLHSSMLERIVKEISHVKLNGHPEKRIFNNIHLTFLGVNGEDLIIKLDEHDIAASTGSACSVHTQKASHVLKAMGFNHEQITGSLRISFGYMNTLNEVNETVEVLKKVIAELRSVSPYKIKYNF
jgi:cysteine desulfurase